MSLRVDDSMSLIHALMLIQRLLGDSGIHPSKTGAVCFGPGLSDPHISDRAG